MRRPLLILVFVVAARAHTSIGADWTWVNGLTNCFGASQISDAARCNFVNNAGIVLLRNYHDVFVKNYFFHGFFVQSFVDYHIAVGNATVGPCLGYLVYGAFNFDKRLCVACGVQCGLFDKVVLACGGTVPIDPHAFVPWSVYPPTWTVSVSAFLYRFRSG